MSPVVKKVLGARAVVGALASVVAGRERPTLELTQRPRAELRETAVEDLDLDRLAARSEEAAREDKAVDPFAPRSFSPLVPAQPGKKDKPTAPPLPFRYLGKMIEDGKLAVFLARGDESLSVSAGSRIGEYRVDKVTDNEVVFTYLPLKTKQSLPL
jgi:Tfp pilus assembly protein PilP